MAKLQYFFLIFVVVMALTVIAPQVDAQKRCTQVLDPNNCVLTTCRQTCLAKYNGNGINIALMAKLQYFFLIFVVVMALTVIAPQVDAQKRCTQVLDPNNCVLATCRQTCLAKYNGNGMCVVKSGGQSYMCQCVYNC
ncbi:hypothetical protein POM88_007643 [Heracleum sosnowskyi]|uniref:Uncharacterized protein n=1 Tax=Heracleum sosnowskyi TaxID=360622 RepID=A0AAD8J8I7_9APIA|nr:hypothetical protein POM88_007643 [Heracleum sosnowskyi]